MKSTRYYSLLINILIMDKYKDKKQEEHCHLAVSAVPIKDGMFSLRLSNNSREKSVHMKNRERAT